MTVFDQEKADVLDGAKIRAREALDLYLTAQQDEAELSKVVA